MNLSSTFAFACLTASVFAQEAWTTAHVAPRAGYGFQMCWHEADNRVLATCVRADSNFMETWERVDGRWQQRCHTTQLPRRKLYALVYDTERRVVVLFGGDVDGVATNEVWEWDSVDWRMRMPTNTPSPRHVPAVTYDARRQVTVVYGGNTANGKLDELWEWDGSNWSQQGNPPFHPGARTGGSMTFDSARGVCVMFGGTTTVHQNDVWEYDGTLWTRSAPAFRPPAVAGASLAFDSTANRSVLYGGGGFAGNNDDVWEWDGSSWQQSAAPGNPGPQQRAGFAYEAQAQRMVLHGGSITTGTWTYDRTTATWQGDAYVATRSSTSARQCFDGNRHTIYWTLVGTLLWDHQERSWQALPPTTVQPPVARGELSYDLNRQEALWFGTPTGGVPETWTLDRATLQWQQRAPANSPPALDLPSLAFDPSSNRTLLFGGNDSGGNVTNETWQWDGNNWTQLSPATRPPARGIASLAFDWPSNRLVLFGGEGSSSLRNDVWDWNGSDWTQRFAQSTAPTPRFAAAMVGSAQGLLLAGGSDYSGEFGELWTLRGNAWQQLDATGMPPGSTLQATFDLARDEMTLFGGTVRTDPSNYPGFTKGVWIYGRPRARQILIGSGCPGANGVPQLAIDAAPVVGQSITLTASHSAPGQPTAFLFGSEVGRVDLVGSCRLLVPTPFAYPVVTAPASGDAMISVNVPAIAELAGLELWTQAIAFDQSATGYALSNAVQMRLGDL